MEEFPNSDYAKLLKDPDYINQLSDANTSIEQTYEQAFALYNKGLYNDCLKLQSTVSEVPKPLPRPTSIYSRPWQKPAKRINQFTFMLEGIINTYPNHQVALTAQEIITLLQNSR